MKKIPDPKPYRDGVQYLRDVHQAILHNCAELETLIADAEKEGVFPSFAAHPVWNDLLFFFSRSVIQHERDEERFLFPLVETKLPRIGFQTADAPIRFLIEGHEMLERQMGPILKTWEAYRKLSHEPELLAQKAKEHQPEDKEFLEAARGLIALYRKHIEIEETKVYREANELLSGTEKLWIADQLRDVYDNEAVTTPLSYGKPQFSSPGIQYTFIPAKGPNAIDAEFEEGEE